MASSWTRTRCAPPAALRASRRSSTRVSGQQAASRRVGGQLQVVDRRAERGGILDCAAFDAAYDAAAGIGDEDGGYIVHSKRSEYFARCVQGERYGHLVLGSIFPQVLGVRPETGCDSEPAQAGISRESAGLLTGAAAGCGDFRPCGCEGGLAPRGQKDQDGEGVIGAVLKLEAQPVDGTQGPLGQRIADSNGRRIVVRNGRAMRTAGVGGVRRCARSHQGRIEFLVREMTNVLYPAVTSDDDVRGRDPEMESCAQAAVVEYDGHGDA